MKPRILMLVHGGESSIEAIRARGLALGLADFETRIAFRSDNRVATATDWNCLRRNFRPDLVYVINTALPGALMAPLWNVFRGQKYILDTGDAIYEMARCSGIRGGWRLPWLNWIERFSQSRAQAIVVRGSKHQEYLSNRGLRQVELIRDGCSSQHDVSDLDVQQLRIRLGLDGRFVIGVLGSLVWSPRLGICYGWDLIETLALLREPDIVGLIVGDGNGTAELERRATQLGIRDRIRFCGRIPYASVPIHLRLMDVALSTQTNNLPGQVRTTGKLPEYMAAGRFVLASRVGEASLVLPRLMLVDYEGEVDREYPIRLAERIRTIKEHPELMEIRRTLPRRAQELFSYQNLSDQCRRVVIQCLGREG